MHSLGFVQWNSTRRDHPGNPGGVSGSGPVKSPIISYLRTKVRGLIFYIRILLHMHVFVCASMCEFQGQNSVKGGRM